MLLIVKVLKINEMCIQIAIEILLPAFCLPTVHVTMKKVQSLLFWFDCILIKENVIVQK